MLPETEKINDYVLRYSSSEDEVLKKLNRETHLTTVYPRMLSGPLQGKLLEFISRMIRPFRILEIGTFTGYSAICMARGLADGGLLHTIDINEEIAEIALRYFRMARLENSIVLHNGNALEIIPRLDEEFDLAFIDGDKEEYIGYFEQTLAKMKTGGFILVDNVLWSGKVLQDTGDNDKETNSIRKFNNFVLKDDRTEKLLLPFRDGLYMLRKLHD